MIIKENLFKKKTISYFEISILILSIFAFSFLVYQSNSFEELKEKQIGKNESFLIKFFASWLKRSRIKLVSAAQVFNCCPVLKNSSASCQDLPAETCQSQCDASCLPTTCQQTSSCKLGCCYGEEQGICDRNTPQTLCEQRHGSWKPDAVCNILECQLGCCILGSNTDFVTERRCQYLSSLNGFALDFKKEANNELSCIILSRQQAKGACVISVENENNCRFLSKVECLKLQGDFHEGLLCSSSGLNTTCSKTSETKCIEGKDEVYFLDSCGNIANIYDARKINDESYWNQIIDKNNSCNPNSGNTNSQTCGNCNYFLGSKCSLEGKKNICIDLNCNNAPSIVDAFGTILSAQDRKNGESWCVYDSAIGQGKDVPGSRHFRYSCVDGKVQVEPCEDYRQGLCVESQVEGEGESMSFASCRPNRWRECLDYNRLAEKKDKEIDYKKVIDKCKANSDCYLKKFDFGKGYDFVQCLPSYPSGFVLQAQDISQTEKGSVCSQANFQCKKIEVKSMMSGWKCVAGCDCDSKKFTQQMNDWCSSLGDCGADVSISGKATDDGYSVDKAPKIDANQYVKNAQPVEGEKADPGNITELLGMISPGNAEDYKGEGGGPIKSIGALILAQLGKGAVGGLIAGAIAVGGESFAFEKSVIDMGFRVYAGVGVTPTQGFLAGAASAGLGALAGSMVGTWIAGMFGLKGEDAYLVGCISGSVAGAMSMAAFGTFGPGIQSIAIFGAPQTFGGLGPLLGPVAAGLVWAIIVAVIISLILGPSEEPRETIVEFKCMQWQAPTGGEDCEKCNNNLDLKTCSRYRCSSLGQTCELLNEGSGNELCAKGEDDRIYPQIKPWEDIVTKGYKYSNIQADSFKLIQENNECVQEFKPVLFGILTNEPAQCKLAINHTTNYEQMNYYFGDSNLYSYNHSIVFNFPSVDSVVSSLGLNGSDASRLRLQLTQKQGDLNFYVRCQDKNGNFNQKEYIIRTCVRQGPDLTPPVINSAIPRTGNYFAFNSTSQESIFYLSEPAECKYLRNDSSYDVMTGDMSCLYSIFTPTCLVTFSNLSSSNKFYIKCKDQPWLDDNNKSRNIMKESYVYELKPSSSRLEIVDVEPNSTIKSGVEPISITLKAKTKGGADGTALCSWQMNSWQDDFALTNSNVHESYLSMMMAGDYHVLAECVDIAGNLASKEWDFKLDLDNQAPRITRIYNSGTLRIVTNEEAECRYDLKVCNFIWENSTQFQTSDSLVHNAAWESGLTYYIKCKDKWGTKSDTCFVARTY